MSKRISFTTSGAVYDRLVALVDTGLYGPNVAAVVEEFVRHDVHEAMKYLPEPAPKMRLLSVPQPVPNEILSPTVKILKIIRAHLSIRLAEAHDLVKAVPVDLPVEHLTTMQATDFRVELRRAGAEVSS